MEAHGYFLINIILSMVSKKLAQLFRRQTVHLVSKLGTNVYFLLSQFDLMVWGSCHHLLLSYEICLAMWKIMNVTRMCRLVKKVTWICYFDFNEKGTNNIMSIVESPHTFSPFKNKATENNFQRRYLWRKHFQNPEQKFDIAVNV